MLASEILQLCYDRDENEFLYDITKLAAESDSIGEGWGYCNNYDKTRFYTEHAEICSIKPDAKGNWPYVPSIYSNYLSQIGLPIYETYLEHIKAPNYTSC